MLTLKNIGVVSPIRSQQDDFVTRFASQSKSKSLLIAAAGTGRTATTLTAVSKMFEADKIDSTLVITDHMATRDQWQDRAADRGIELAESMDRTLTKQGLAITLRDLQETDALRDFVDATKDRTWLIIADGILDRTQLASPLIDQFLSANKNSKSLFIANCLPSNHSFESEFQFDIEYIIGHSIIEARDTEARVARFSPSYSLLHQCLQRPDFFGDLSWRDFEKLVATLLERDGYDVELMAGSKDGGVDVVAVKDHGPCGYFKTLWQAKKHSRHRKVGISIVRELADTHQEFGASKGIVVTTSFLTRGALTRIERDKYLLGKVERNELDSWIRRTLFGFDL